ncbi:MAG: hypothetical protein WKF81_03020 [Thermomicrobiales bacterium]
MIKLRLLVKSTSPEYLPLITRAFYAAADFPLRIPGATATVSPTSS